MESIRDNTIIEQTEDGWTVTTLNGNKTHTIDKSKTHCSCELKCPECSTCVHNYFCSCPDSLLKWNMCKHIHLLCQKNTNIQDIKKYSQEIPCKIDTVDNSELVMENSDTVIDFGVEEQDNFAGGAEIDDCSNTRDEEFDTKAQNMDYTLKELSNSSVTCSQEENYDFEDLENYKSKLLHTFKSILEGITTREECNVVENTLSSLEPTLAALGCTNMYVISSNEELDDGTVFQKTFVPLKKQTDTKSPILRQLWKEIN